jgi:hypothetical protein
MPTAQITHNTQHINIGLSRLILQFQGKPRFTALLAAILNEGQAVEDMFYGLLVRALDNPNVSGVTLDTLGKIVGQTRQGQVDATYIPYLKARIKTNLSNGTVETLLGIVVLLVAPTTPILFREYTKAVEIEVDGVTANAYQVWQQFLEFAKPAGTSLKLIFSKSPSSATMKYTSSSSSFTTTTTQRFGSSWTVGTGGGVLAGMFG